MRVTLHIGAWKTGSTAVQSFLAANRDVLRSNNIYVPQSMDLGARAEAIDRLQSGSAAEADLVIEEYAALVRGHEQNANIVVSSEHFWPMSPEVIEYVGNALFRLTKDVQIVLYVRPQDDMWNSLYCQQAKGFGVAPSAALWGTTDFVGAAIADWALYYYRCLGMFANKFGVDAVHARPYVRERLRGGDVALDFMDYLGIDNPDLISPQVMSNPSLGWKGVAFSLWIHEKLNVRARGDDDFQAIRKAFRTAVRRMNIQTDDTAWIGKAPNILTLEQRQEIRKNYAEDNRQLFDKYFQGEDVFGGIKDRRVDSIKFEDVPQLEFEQAKRKLLNILRVRKFKVGDLDKVLNPQLVNRPKGILGFVKHIIGRVS